MVIYRLGNTVRTKLLNYKETINSISVDEEVASTLSTEACECENSQSFDTYPKHTIMGDFRISDNSKLRKLMINVPN